MTATQGDKFYEVLSCEQGKAIIDSGDSYILLDVRPESEYRAKHLEGALHIPDSELVARAAAELPNKDETLLVYCNSGRRSAISSQQLANLGYTRVFDMEGVNTWPYGTVSE